MGVDAPLIGSMHGLPLNFKRHYRHTHMTRCEASFQLEAPNLVTLGVPWLFGGGLACRHEPVTAAPVWRAGKPRTENNRLARCKHMCPSAWLNASFAISSGVTSLP